MSETPFWPREITPTQIFVWALWAFIAGTVGSLFILLVMFLFGNYFNVSWVILDADLGTATNSMFPFTISIVSLFGISIALFATYTILWLVNPDRYKKNSIIAGQIGFFSILTYLFLTPVYIFAGIVAYKNITFVFLAHTLIATFWVSVIIELLNNYRYILTGIYGSFVGLFVSLIITLLIFASFWEWFAKLLSLLFILPTINASITLFKWLFELAYFKYHRYTNMDQLGDIFYQVEMEERETARQEQLVNSWQ